MSILAIFWRAVRARPLFFAYCGANVVAVTSFIIWLRHRDAEHVQQGVRQEQNHHADSTLVVLRDSLARLRAADDSLRRKAAADSVARVAEQRKHAALVDSMKAAQRALDSGLAVAKAEGTTDIPISLVVPAIQTCQAVANDSGPMQRMQAELNTAQQRLANVEAQNADLVAQNIQLQNKVNAGAPPAPSRVKPFVAGVLTGVAALVAVIHFVK